MILTLNLSSKQFVMLCKTCASCYSTLINSLFERDTAWKRLIAFLIGEGIHYTTKCIVPPSSSLQQVSESTTAVQYCNEQTTLAVKFIDRGKIDKGSHGIVNHCNSSSGCPSFLGCHFLGEYNNNTLTN